MIKNVMFVFGIFLLFFEYAHSQSTKMDQPNIILIMIDDMGYGDLSCYHPNSKIKTVHLVRMGSQGMRFTEVQSSLYAHLIRPMLPLLNMKIK
ncbi:MAG: hypothetical protein WD431_18140 [Cyclobacteriaceae bacterium]